MSVHKAQQVIASITEDHMVTTDEIKLLCKSDIKSEYKSYFTGRDATGYHYDASENQVFNNFYEDIKQGRYQCDDRERVLEILGNKVHTGPDSFAKKMMDSLLVGAVVGLPVVYLTKNAYVMLGSFVLGTAAGYFID